MIPTLAIVGHEFKIFSVIALQTLLIELTVLLALILLIKTSLHFFVHDFLDIAFDVFSGTIFSIDEEATLKLTPLPTW